MPFDESARDALVRQIEIAFDAVSLGDGIGILEAWAIDRCVSDKERQRARARDYRADWTLIPDSVLEEHYSALSFMDPEGLRFALPAYMRFTARNFEKSQSLSVDAPIYSLGSGWPVAPGGPEFLTKLQGATIAKFLRVMVVDIGEEYVDATAASQAYDNFWVAFDDGP